MELYTRPKAAAAMLDVSIKLVYRLIASGELRAVRVGRCVRILTESLQEFLRRNETGAAKPPPAPVSRPALPVASAFQFLPPRRS